MTPVEVRQQLLGALRLDLVGPAARGCDWRFLCGRSTATAPRRVAHSTKCGYPDQPAGYDCFGHRPEWKQAKAESEKEGVLTADVQSKNMKATDYSPMP